MEPFRGKIGIIGSGALGGFYGARLARAGNDVHFLMRSDYETVRAKGLEVRSVDGDFHIKPPVYSDAAAMGVCDLVLIGLKTSDNAVLPALLEPVARSHTVVITLQNGLGNEETIAAALAANEARRHNGSSPDTYLEPCRGQTLGGPAFLCSNRIALGVISHTAHGWVRLAELTGPAKPRTHAIAGMFRAAGIACEVFDSLAYIRWAKLVWNIPFNGLAVAAGGADTAVILGDDSLRNTARGLMEEVIAAARAEGAGIAGGFVDEMMRSTASMGNYRTSMQIDYEESRALEVESILGEPLRRALRGGVAVPRMEMLYGIVRRLDELRRTAASLSGADKDVTIVAQREDFPADIPGQ